MPAENLTQTAKTLVAPGKGILAADESESTIKKRLEGVQVESTEDTRRTYRELLFTTEGIEEYISGIILFGETLRLAMLTQGKTSAKILEEKGIIPGIKVDKKAHPMANFPGEKITEGLDGLGDRLAEYKDLGARFTKWRAVITIGKGIPTDTCINSNAEALARFASLSQEAGLVPIVEPEVIRDGGHGIEACEEVTYKTLKIVFNKLADHKVNLSGILLKPNMVTPGKESQDKASPEKVAETTLRCMKEVVPGEVSGIVFLSGGQTPEKATVNLNAMNVTGDAPWELSFSFSRALQTPVLVAWKGKSENKEIAQKVFEHRVILNSKARTGEYKPEMEKDK